MATSCTCGQADNLHDSTCSQNMQLAPQAGTHMPCTAQLQAFMLRVSATGCVGGDDCNKHLCILQGRKLLPELDRCAL